MRRIAVYFVLMIACGPDAAANGGVESGDEASTVDGTTVDATTDVDDTGLVGGTRPFRDDWRVVHEGPFIVLDGSGGPLIRELTIGSALGYNDNFVNRGDVIVAFDGPADRITIELRRFTYAVDDADAQADFAKLSLWAFNADVGSPARPDDMPPDADCTAAGWLDGCAIYVFYDGLNQLIRSGADIRVTLPPDYRQRIAISTSDNVAEDEYPNRGNVCVSNLDASVDVELQSGLAFVTLAPTATPSPQCAQAAPELLDECVNGAEPWVASCGCFAQNYELGRVKIDTLIPSAGALTVDITQPDLWMAFRAENAGMNDVAGTYCPATVDAVANVEFSQNDPMQPWRLVGEANHPSPSAPAGAGFSLQLTSNGCESVAAVESPEEWDPNVEPTGNVRGDVSVCAGCLAGMNCEALLPG